MKAQDAGEVG